ncbi:MAG: hypothetical protein GX222_03400 [Ruminococcaceae bacterium]|nr:hypothetical protein [Oscillospiraceae bacterium]
MRKAKELSNIPILLIILVVSAIFTACCMNLNPSSTVKSDGAILLKVNPELSIRYDGDGMVTEIKAKNSDGKVILDNYGDYVGKDTKTAIIELVGKINEAGYFAESEAVNVREVVLEFEEGSKIPNMTFSNEISEGVKSKIR